MLFHFNKRHIKKKNRATTYPVGYTLLRTNAFKNLGTYSI